MYIMSLGVVTEYRRCGIAKKLVNHVVAHALRFRECTAVGCSHHGAWPYACRVPSLNMSWWWYRCSCMCCGPMPIKATNLPIGLDGTYFLIRQENTLSLFEQEVNGEFGHIHPI